MVNNKQFVNIVAAFKFVTSEHEIHVLCDEPGFDFAVINVKKGTCATIGKLRDDIEKWLLGEKEKTFKIAVGSSSFTTLTRVPVPEVKHYNVFYGSIHHVDER